MKIGSAFYPDLNILSLGFKLHGLPLVQFLVLPPISLSLMMHIITEAPQHPPRYSRLVDSVHPPTSFGFSKPSNVQSPGAGLVDIAPTHSSNGALPDGLTKPPLSPSISDCCKPDMVLKRGSIGCHCVYPIKLDILLLNVSDTPSWNMFLNEFASQLGLLPHQIELINFYMLRLSRINISMHLTPHSGISSSASQASAINSSLISHKIMFSPTLVGDDKLLNFTWFEAPEPFQEEKTPDPHKEVGTLEAGSCFIRGISSPPSKGRWVWQGLQRHLSRWYMRMKIALDVAKGLAYLHEDSQPSVIHRDFKASNILLENNFNAKVADFGLAKQAPEGRGNHLSTRVMGTFGYVAPEYAMTGHLLVKSDVYSYGIVFLELLTGRKPVDMSQPSGQENLIT
ncbi:hypothetical protein N665_1055s0002 [Sinapis alba]|nr:hypothetical protein N665_1055s0002 [Sinapis alba]